MTILQTNPLFMVPISQKKLAEEAVELLSSDNNPYGESQNKDDTIEIEHMEVTETYPLI